ncbi:hypothetical protein HRW09_36950 [Streptomyces lunaelactis]|nr:hypothetical protein [Streptomyces lunaelactis]
MRQDGQSDGPDCFFTGTVAVSLDMDHTDIVTRHAVQEVGDGRAGETPQRGGRAGALGALADG